MHKVKILKLFKIYLGDYEQGGGKRKLTIFNEGDIVEVTDSTLNDLVEAGSAELVNAIEPTDKKIIKVETKEKPKKKK